MNFFALVVAPELGVDLPSADSEKLTELTIQQLAVHVDGPRELEPGSVVIKMIVAGPDGGGGFSLKWRNLLGVNPLNPRVIKDALAVGGALSAASALSISGFGAFFLAATVLAVRPVSREEALIMHMAQRIARFDGTFTLADMLAAADELRNDYLVDKVSEVDLCAHLNNLERAGALSPTSSGYRLAETIKLMGR